MAASHPPQPVSVRLGFRRRVVLYALNLIPLYTVIATMVALLGGVL